jgi:hypothetical protein
MRVMTGAAAPFPFDARIPELADAVDAQVAAPLLARHLLADSDLRVEGCRVTRLRYRPEDRCVLQYALTLSNLRTGASSTELVTGTVYADSRRAARRAACLPGATFVPELRMIASLFPEDRKLPQASAVVAGSDPTRHRAVLETFGPGVWQVLSWNSHVVRYREGLSLVVRYVVRACNVKTAETRERVFFAKAYPEREVARRTFDQLERLARHSANDGTVPKVDAGTALIDHLGVVLLPAAAGRPLSDIIARPTTAAALAAARESAQALAAFNLSDAPVRRDYTTTEYVASLGRPARVLVRACPQRAEDLRAVLAAAERLPDGQHRPTHRDMKPEHVFLGAGRPTFIDMDSCALADPALDIALMLARFTVLGFSPGGADMKSTAAAFADEYFTHVPHTWRTHLPTYFAASLLEGASGLFHRQESDWQQSVPSLIAAAAAIVRGSVDFDSFLTTP